MKVIELAILEGRDREVTLEIRTGPPGGRNTGPQEDLRNKSSLSFIVIGTRKKEMGPKYMCKALTMT